MNPPRQPPCSSESRAQGCTLPRGLGSTAEAYGAPPVWNNHSNNPNNDRGKVQGGRQKKVQVGRNNTSAVLLPQDKLLPEID